MTDPTERDPTLPSSYPEPSLGGGVEPAGQLRAEESASVETEDDNPEAQGLATADEPTETDVPQVDAAVAEGELKASEEGDEDEGDEGDEDDEETDYETPIAAGAAGAAGAATQAAGARPDARRPDGRKPAAPAGPTPSETAVHVSDRASAAFVIVVVLAFVAILGYGLLGGVGGFLTPIPTPAPLPSEAPSTGPSVAPSAAPSGSVAPSGSAAPSAVPSASGGASSAAPSPSPAPSAAPTPSPAPSPSPSS